MKCSTGIPCSISKGGSNPAKQQIPTNPSQTLLDWSLRFELIYSICSHIHGIYANLNPKCYVQLIWANLFSKIALTSISRAEWPSFEFLWSISFKQPKLGKNNCHLPYKQICQIIQIIIVKVLSLQTDPELGVVSHPCSEHLPWILVSWSKGRRWNIQKLPCDVPRSWNRLRAFAIRCSPVTVSLLAQAMVKSLIEWLAALFKKDTQTRPCVLGDPVVWEIPTNPSAEPGCCMVSSTSSFPFIPLLNSARSKGNCSQCARLRTTSRIKDKRHSAL